MNGFIKKFLDSFLSAFLFCSFTLSNTVHADGPAPPVTEFYIRGYDSLSCNYYKNMSTY